MSQKMYREVFVTPKWTNFPHESFDVVKIPSRGKPRDGMKVFSEITMTNTFAGFSAKVLKKLCNFVAVTLVSAFICKYVYADAFF